MAHTALVAVSYSEGDSEAEMDAFMDVVAKMNDMRGKAQEHGSQVVEQSRVGDDVPCPTGVGCLEEGATAWGPIDIIGADWSTGSPRCEATAGR